MTERIQFGSKELVFNLTFSERKTLGITVTPDMDILVKAPIDTSIEKVKEKVQKRAHWILKQQSYFLAFYPKSKPKKYISGESHLYLGRQFKLKVVEGNANSVKLKAGILWVTALEKSKAEILLKAWYLDHARAKFHQLAAPFVERFKKYNVAPSSIVLRDMPKRWGSCTPTGKIILNPELIKAPRACIEYVIVHELCHLIHHDHTKKFIELQSKEFPNWEKWKGRLENLLS